MDEVDFTRMRRSYEATYLLESAILADPLAQLQRWLQEAHAAGVLEPHAMCVSTVSENRPSSRMVLLRGLDARGLVFYTSYFSRKGREISANPHAAALFYWAQLERQVRVEGSVDQLSEDESDAYFAGRPRGHQLGAWASEQSEPVETREILDQRMQDYTERFEGDEVPRPHSWGGYIIRPERIEFWQGRSNRMHDRLEFVRGAAAWTMRRLQP
jgi:pyridoxamine 5'-phosphate oxidase